MLLGVSGTFAALITTSFEKPLLPTKFLASTFHLQFCPANRVKDVEYEVPTQFFSSYMYEFVDSRVYQIQQSITGVPPEEAPFVIVSPILVSIVTTASFARIGVSGTSCITAPLPTAEYPELPNQFTATTLTSIELPRTRLNGDTISCGNGTKQFLFVTIYELVAPLQNMYSYE